jgi:hypothetical protein
VAAEALAGVIIINFLNIVIAGIEAVAELAAAQAQ